MLPHKKIGSFKMLSNVVWGPECSRNLIVSARDHKQTSFVIKKKNRINSPARTCKEVFQSYLSRSQLTIGANVNAPIPEPQTAMPVAIARLVEKYKPTETI